MSGRIPQKFIDELLDRVDIVEIIDSRVKLRKTGRNYSALCPFHQEKTPSFSVNPDKQFYYCFGCGAGGNVLGFLIEYERLDFPVAVETLAKHAGMQVPQEEGEDKERAEQRRNIYTLLEKSSEYFQRQLIEHPQAPQAVDYLKQRGLSGKIAKQFGIGYAPPGWDNLLKQFATNDQDKALLEESGMLIRKDDGNHYDRFRHRIMFPIRDNRGRTIAFGGRVLGDDKPKYLNSPETSVFLKSRELYGLVDVRHNNKHIDHIIMVEGYMDVVALAQHGINNAVATLGTATSETHLEKVFRHCTDVVFCFDGDEAGRKAANRALDASLTQMQDGRQARFLFLAEGEDPDSLVRKIGAEQFRHQVSKATPLSDYVFESASAGIDIQSMDGRAKLSKRALAKIQRLPEGVFRRLMLNALAERTGLSNDSLDELIEHQDQVEQHSDPGATASDPGQSPSGYAAGKRQRAPLPRRAVPKRGQKLKNTPARSAITLLLYYPNLAKELVDLHVPDNHEDEEVRLLAKLLQMVQEQPDCTTYGLLGHWMGTPEGELMTALLANTPVTAEQIEESTAAREITDCISHINHLPKKRDKAALISELNSNKSITFNDLTDEQKSRIQQLFADRSEP